MESLVPSFLVSQIAFRLLHREGDRSAILEEVYTESIFGASRVVFEVSGP